MSEKEQSGQQDEAARKGEASTEDIATEILDVEPAGDSGCEAVPDSENTEPEDQFTDIERRIMQAAAKGEVADFSDEGERPSVSGKFLADLWSGLIAGHDMHPRGLRIKALIIDGVLGCDSNRLRDGYDPLPALEFQNCEFSGGIDASHASITRLSFLHCRFGKSFPEANEFYEYSLELSGATISRDLVLEDCQVPALVGLGQTQVLGDLSLQRTSIEQSVWAVGITVKGNLAATSCKFGDAGTFQGEPIKYSLDMGGSQIGGDCNFTRCRFLRAVGLQTSRLNYLSIDHCHITDEKGVGYALGIFATEFEVGFHIIKTIIVGSVNGNSLHSGGNVLLEKVLIRANSPDDGLLLANAELNANLNLYSSRIENGLLAQFTSIGGALHIKDAVMRQTQKAGRAMEMFNGSCAGLFVDNSLVYGDWNLSNFIVKGECQLTNVAVLPSLDQTSQFDALTEELPEAEDGASKENWRRFFARGNTIDGSLSVDNCLFTGGFRFSACELRGGAYFERSLFLNAKSRVSCDMHSTVAREFTTIKGCAFSSGLFLTQTKWSAFSMSGCGVGVLENDTSHTLSIWADGLQCETELEISYDFNNGHSATNEFMGPVYMREASIGGSLYVKGAHFCFEEDSDDLRVSNVLDLAYAKVAKDLIIGHRLDTIDRDRYGFRAPVFEGALNLDDAHVGGDLAVHHASLYSRGEVARPMTHFSTEERVSKRKRGVAISMRDADILGDLEVGKPELTKITGIVDLRDSTVGLISDGGGDRWEAAGVKAGHLLLDGLTYRDLDNVYDGDEPKGLEKRESSAARRRLRWLTMQYPDHEATPDTFVPQPYEQLASIFAAEGNEHARRLVHVERRDLQRKHGRLSRFEKVVGWLLKATSRYGYSSGRAVSVMLAYFIVGAIAAFALDSAGAIELLNTDSNQDLRFNAIFFAVDSAIPIIDLGQDSIWGIEPSGIAPPFWQDAIIFTKGLYEIIGMLLLSITILTLTGTLRENS